MKQTQILTGKFTSGDGAKGNFTGYNAKGERIFINKQAMAAIGLDDDAKVTKALPIYAIVDEREFNSLDPETGKPTDSTFKRLQALSAFKTADAMTDAINADDRFAIDASANLNDYAKSKGIVRTKVQMDSLVNASV